MNTDFIKGVVVPMITPIDKDELIDEAAIRSQVDYVIDGGVSGILLFGSAGSSGTLLSTDRDHHGVFEPVRKRRRTVIFHSQGEKGDTGSK